MSEDDLRSGGSWLAIARDGRFAGVTNQRARQEPSALVSAKPAREAVREAAPRSRGELVLDLVAQGDRDAMRAYVGGLDATLYASGNLMFGDASGADVAYVRRAGTVELVALGRGMHVLTNDRLGSPDFPKADLAAQRLAAHAGEPWPLVRDAVPAILGDHSMLGLQALCIHTPVYGTRSATLAAIGAGGTEALLWADGPPCTTPFVDAMPLYA